jgi:hypothetical protein
VLEEFGTYSNPRDITFSTLKSCSYLQWVLNETLRLHPVVPLDGRRALKDTTTLPTGGGPNGDKPIYVREGVQVDYSVYVIQRRKDLWGEDADEFRPERWNGRKSGWEYLPFNGGPRICIGQQVRISHPLRTRSPLISSSSHLPRRVMFSSDLRSASRRLSVLETAGRASRMAVKATSGPNLA